MTDATGAAGAPAAAPSLDAPHPPATRPARGGGVGRAARGVGAVAFWGLAQGLFLAVPPAAGIVVNLAVAAGFVWWFVLRDRARADARRRSTLRLRAIPAGARPWIAPAALALVAVVLSSLVVMPRFVRIPDREIPILEAYLKQPLGPVAVLLMVAVIAPLLEEFLFRGWLQRRLERRATPWAAIVVTAVLFGLAHAELFGLPLRTAFGVASGYAAWATRSIWPSVLLHGAYNASLVVVSGALPDVDERTLEAWARTDAVFFPALLVLAAAGAALAWTLRRMRAGAAASRAGVARAGASLHRAVGTAAAR